MRTVLALVLAAALAAGLDTAGAQQCDDGNSCTANDQCSASTCVGTPQAGGSCDDHNECTVNDRCFADGRCRGSFNVPVGSSCAGGCGTCQSVVPIPGGQMVCVGNAADNGRSCDASLYGPCLEGTCQVINDGGFAIAGCFPRPLKCPLTGDCNGGCNPETGRCDDNIPQCAPGCERCEQGQCVPANQGAACDDHNACTPQSRCETVDLGAGLRGVCRRGVPTGDMPTPTMPAPVHTPTPTPLAPPTPGICVGDCNGNGEVVINELITGVNIAVGSARLDQCPTFDRNGSGEVEINELIQGVNAALNGCAA